MMRRVIFEFGLHSDCNSKLLSTCTCKIFCRTAMKLSVALTAVIPLFCYDRDMARVCCVVGGALGVPIARQWYQISNSLHPDRNSR